jgi:hypothetical protein
MLKRGAFFLILVGLISFHAGLAVDNKSFLFSDRRSEDGWSHSCRYYRPFSTVRVTRPIQVPCARYDNV